MINIQGEIDMQIKIGEKIRELRRRDGRKQEDLANAIGVTCQAISRWEANGGYPDMEIVPAIANYFHVSIDELFGYDGNREDKIRKILDDAEKAITSNEDMTACVEMLRDAVEEFPTETRLLQSLGFALHIHGWRMHGLKGQSKDGSDYGFLDTEYNARNIWWQEAMQVFEKLLKSDDVPDREAVIMLMAVDYSKMGMYDKAKALAEKQNTLIISRECLMTHATEGEEQDKYLGEAIIALMNELKKHLETSVATKKSLLTSGVSVQKMLALAHFYEEIFDDGRFGVAHANMRDIYLSCSIFEAIFGDIKKAVQYFDIAFNHHTEYLEIREKGGDYSYSSPLVSKVVSKQEAFPKVSEDGLKDYLKAAPEKLIEEIKKNKKYASAIV